MSLSLALLFALAFCAAGLAANAPTFDTVREHIQKGRYEEALEALDALEQAKQDAAQIALARSHAQQALGKWQEAVDVIRAAVKADEQNAALIARQAELYFLRGRYEEAEKAANEAIRLDADQPLARLVQAEVFTETGRIPQALEGYRWFIRYYNRAQPQDADVLVLIARGSSQYARWKRVSQIFGFAVNTLCPDALAKDPACWQSLYVSGTLLSEKFNDAQAQPEFDKALAINPRATPVLVAKGNIALEDHKLKEAQEFAERALAVDANHVEALCLMADLRLSSGKLGEARKFLEQALTVNPHDQRTLGRKAACNLFEDGLPPDDEWESVLSNLANVDQVTLASPSRFSNVLIEVAKRNAHPGYFLTILAEAMEQQRRFAPAERLYRQAVASMPELSQPRAALGMLHMHMGKTDEAEKLLDEAFAADPYHIRVSNMRKVARLLKGYETIATEHFVIHVDTEHDKILGRYMADYLEEIYPDLVKQFGFEPPARTQFEIYHDAKGLSAHQWFSARMVGLPWIQTIGTSTGMIVALASPTAAETPYNWARVVKHEFVHIITLQQTGFKIPHWFTEALAVGAEGYDRPEIWNKLLRERVPKGELRTLENLNEGFIRPESPLDWQFAYCQSRLYAQYLVETFGAEAIPRLLDLYRQNVPTEKAIPQVCGIDMPAFEAGYRKFLDKIVASLGEPDEAGGPSRTLEELETLHGKSPDDVITAGQYAAALLAAGKKKEARELAQQVLAKDPAEPSAALTFAELELLSEDVDSAAACLEKALDREHLHRRVLVKLASVKVRARDFAAAAKLCELGREKFPQEVDFMRGLAAIYKKLGENERLKPVLVDLARRDPDDVEPRKELAQLAQADKNFADVVKFGTELLQIDVMDVETHRMLAEAYGELGQTDRAIREYETLGALAPDDDDLAMAFAKVLIAANRKEDAKKQLERVAKRKADNKDAEELLKEVTGE